MEKNIHYGQIIAAAADGSLSAIIETGETVTVPAAETSRRPLRSYEWLVGKTLGMIETEEGFCSIKEYEEQRYREVVAAFLDGTRNTYTARLSSVPDGKLAFYKLDPYAEGLAGSIAPRDLALQAPRSFDSVDLPRELQVVIKKLEGGKIILTSAPVYGTFEENVARLGVTEGSVHEGTVAFVVPGGMAIVALAPNLSAIARGSVPLQVGDRVRATVTAIDTELLRIRCEAEPTGDMGLDRGFYAAPFAQLGEVTDLEQFLAAAEVKKTAPAREAAPVEPLSYELAAASSPFRLLPGETARHCGAAGATAKAIAFQVQHGHLTDKHLTIAKAVNRLRFGTGFQIQRYLDCAYDVQMAAGVFRRALDHLVSLNIVQRAEIVSPDRTNSIYIYLPGMNYRAFTNERPTLGPAFFAHQPDAVTFKYSLAGNQLLIGLMHSRSLSEEHHDVHPRLEHGDIRLHPRHRLTVGGDVFYLEAVRGDRYDDMLGKLKRYAEYAAGTGEKFTVLCTMEEESEITSFASRVAALELEFEVQLTSDLACLPEPAFTVVPAARKSSRNIFARIRQFFFNAAVAGASC